MAEAVGGLKRWPALTLAFGGLTAMGLVAQLVFPSLVHLFQRDAAEIVGGGQWWRLVTSLFFQDGGVLGGLSNIAALMLVGGLAEQVFAPMEWVVIYWAGALAAGIVGLWWQPVGAGNSIAICSLGGAVAAGWPSEWRLRMGSVWRGIAAVVGGVLLARRDIHGVGFVFGVVWWVVG